MNTRQSNLTPTLFGSLILCSALHLQAETTIYLDDFSGTSADLNDTTPDIGANNWVASTSFNADGSTNDGAGSATLAFTPTDGFIYQLDATYSGLGLATTAGDPENDWFALGFANGQSTGSGNDDRFITGNVSGVAWMLSRGDTSQDLETFSWLGTGALGTGNGGLAGENVGTEMSTLTSIDMRIILDTTGGTDVTDWTATWQAKLPAAPSYTTLRTENLLAGSTISAVGLARSNAGVNGKVENFSLTSDSPSGSVNLQLTISQNTDTPESFDFQWASKAGKSYDLVSSSDLSIQPELWPVWEDNSGIQASETGINSLSAIGAEDPSRFFAILEKDSPPPAQ